MQQDKKDRAALVATLSASGFGNNFRDVECLAFSKATVEGNEAVHLKANEQLLEVLMREDAGPCYHITGEMRALADRFHRRLCLELNKRADSRFVVIYNIPEEFRQTPDGVGKWSSNCWGSKSWTEKLSAMRLIGDQVVDVRAYNTTDEIQYSVFGNRYVLLQEKHWEEVWSHKSKPKRVWLLRSAHLNEFLTAKAMKIANVAADIPETLFRRFSARVNGITSRIILNTLARNGVCTSIANVIDKDLEHFDPEASRELEALKAIGFVSDAKEGQLCITPSGEHFLSTVGRDCPSEL